MVGIWQHGKSKTRDNRNDCCPSGIRGARIGLANASQKQTTRVLNGLLHAGVNFVDTASSYLTSEKMIGTAIGSRRDEYYLATKAPHQGVQGPWTKAAITGSINDSSRKLRTEVIDLIQLQVATSETLREGEAVEALLAARDAGRCRYVGYSSDGPNALTAVEWNVFDTLQMSFNVVDHEALTELIPAA